MRLTATALPTATATLNRNNIQTRLSSSLLNRVTHLTCLSTAQTNVAISVPNGNDSFKPRFLASVSLLLHQVNVNNFFLKVRNQRVNNLILRNLQATQENLINGRNLAFLNHLTQTCPRNQRI